MANGPQSAATSLRSGPAHKWKCKTTFPFPKLEKPYPLSSICLRAIGGIKESSESSWARGDVEVGRTELLTLGCFLGGPPGAAAVAVIGGAGADEGVETEDSRRQGAITGRDSAGAGLFGTKTASPTPRSWG